MPEKQKHRDRKEIPTVLAAFAMTLIVAMWNAFSNHDRHKVEAASPNALMPAIGNISDACTTPVPAKNTGARCMTVTRTRSS